MATFEAYPVGSKVKILKPRLKPDNWNRDMLRLAGVVTTIRHVKVHGPNSSIENRRYIYTLVGWTWSWRHCDLELLELAKADPNTLFRMKKQGNDHATR